MTGPVTASPPGVGGDAEGMWITFLGAAGTVTGSRHLVETGSARILLDCGMYQGERELRRRNWESLGDLAVSVDAVVLSHAHLDHSGLLPRLAADGYRGPVYCTPSTAELAAIVLRDAAHLQEEDALHAGRVGSSKHHPARPLFDRAAAERAIERLRPVDFGRPVRVGDAEIVLRRAGHILGSATVSVTDGASTVVFTGDLGRRDHPLLRPPAPMPRCDAAIVESTYGDRVHPPRTLDRLAEAVTSTIEAGGVVLAPAFAVDRTAVLLMALRELMDGGRVPRVPVHVDSPMALEALDVYRKAVAGEAADVRPQHGHDPFDPGDLHLVAGREGSIRLNQPGEPCVIVSAAGMLSGGRAVHHFAALAPHARNTILLPGFQVPGTRGRALIDGVGEIKAFGRYIRVRARVVALEEFSAHADGPAMLEWLRPNPPGTVYIVHGEHGASEALADGVRRELDRPAVIPRLGERVRV